MPYYHTAVNDAIFYEIVAPIEYFGDSADDYDILAIADAVLEYHAGEGWVCATEDRRIFWAIVDKHKIH